MLTLAVTPEQAAAIERARSKGALTTLVRNPRDLQLSPQVTTPVQESPASTSPPRPRAIQEPAVELIVGSEKVTP
jgi:Flp pilus assembly protein CpaB